MGKQKKVRNPLTGKKLRPEAAEYVLQAREARRQARRDARSGNPAKRAAALSVLRAAPRIIRAVYAQEANR